MPSIFSDHSGLSRLRKYVALCTETVHLWAPPFTPAGHIKGVAHKVMIDMCDNPPKQTKETISAAIQI